MIELGSRERKQPAPAHVVLQSLRSPRDATARAWLFLLDDEVEPRILSSDATSVVWSSVWPDRPDDVIRFDVRQAGPGSSLRWTLLTPAGTPDASKLGHLRRRLNVLINENLRLSYGQ